MTSLDKREYKVLDDHELDALIEHSSEAVIVEDINDAVCFWNDTAERLYGWTKEEVLGQNGKALKYCGESEEFERIKNEILEKGEWYGEATHRTKSGKTITVESKRILIRDEQGNPKSILIMNTDVTGKKALEEQFRRAQRMESLGAIASGIAHDLNNIFAPILMSITIFKKFLKDETNQRLLGIVESSANRGKEIVKQIVTFARGAAGEKTVVSPRYVLEEVLRLTKETFPKDIQVTSSIPKDIWNVLADATQLHQVLMNLTINARDSMPSGGTLKLSVENAYLDGNYVKMRPQAKIGRHAVISVEDTGIGMSPEIKEKIFDPFFTTKQLTEGTGLGLSTSLSIVTGFGGFIEVHSKVGIGSTFKVFLPAVELLEEEITKPLSLFPIGNGECILIVDDEAVIREITKHTLEVCGYTTLLAKDGAEAVAQYVQHRDEVKVILVDMIMPVMDGVATIRALRTISSDVAILAASGLATNDDVLRSVGSEIQDFIAKPYTAEAILKKLNEVLYKELG